MELYHKGIIKEQDLDGISMKRGDGDAIIAAVHKIGKQEGFGTILKDGVVDAAKKIGKGAKAYAMHVKGLEMQLYEYRPLKGMALSQAVSHKDHIDANPLAEVDELIQALMKGDNTFSPSYDDKSSVVLGAGKTKIITDMLGVCQFFDLRGHNVPLLSKLLSLATGIETTEDELYAAAQRVLTLERAFAVMGGIKKKDDTLPERMFKEPISGGFFKGQQLEKKQFNKMVGEYYDLCGWDTKGIPKPETFQELDMEGEAETFYERMKMEPYG
jgi:aldehyde:ferredoxin oxidoreductase